MTPNGMSNSSRNMVKARSDSVTKNHMRSYSRYGTHKTAQFDCVAVMEMPLHTSTSMGLRLPKKIYCVICAAPSARSRAKLTSTCLTVRSLRPAASSNTPIRYVRSWTDKRRPSRSCCGLPVHWRSLPRGRPWTPKCIITRGGKALASLDSALWAERHPG